MKKFDVYHHPTHGYEAVKEGFSWPGFFFVYMWAFSKKMWLLGLGLAAAAVTFSALETVFAVKEMADLSLLAKVAQAGVSLAAGFYGNEWWAARLRERGYKLVRSVDNVRTRDSALAEVAAVGAEPAPQPIG